MDIALLPTLDGGDITLTDRRDIPMSISLFQSAYISVFSDDFWGNSVLGLNQKLRSRLTQASRGNLTPSIRNLVSRSIADSLEWMKRIGVAESIDVETEIASNIRLNIQITITKPSGEIEILPFGLYWDKLQVEL
jgi:phage gp46-like protein